MPKEIDKYMFVFKNNEQQLFEFNDTNMAEWLKF